MFDRFRSGVLYGRRLKQQSAQKKSLSVGRPGLVEPMEPRYLLANFILYVDAGVPMGGEADGQSWQTAYTDLQAALAAANPGASDTYEIRVAGGTYKPTGSAGRTISFRLKNRVSLLGGYAGVEAVNPMERNVAAYATILSGEIGTAASTDNSYRVLDGSMTNHTAVLDGFTITGGNANAGMTYVSGGGMYIDRGSPTIRNCTFIGNRANQGGGMYSVNSAPSLTNCVFVGNSAQMFHTGHGGGMHNEASSPVLINCAFYGNTAFGSGGGMYNSNLSNSTLVNCVFTNNTADQPGGAIASAQTTLTLINCTVAGNYAPSTGGIYASNASAITLTNCLVWGNPSFYFPQHQINAAGGTVTVTHSLVQGGFTGAGNINADPLFVRNPGPGPDAKWGTADDDYGDVRLRYNSPAIDAGRNTAVPADIATDIAGRPRFSDVLSAPDTGLGTAPIVDMGAHEMPMGVAADRLRVRVAADGSIHLWRNGMGAGEADYSLPAGAAITLAGSDAIILDFSGGNPLAGNPIQLEGSGAAAVILAGLSSGAAVAAGAGALSVDGHALACAGVEGIRLDAGEGETIGLASLALDGTTVALEGGKGLVLRVQELTIGGGTLDLADGMLIIQTADPAAAQQALAAVNAKIGSARNATPLWSGRGITSTLLHTAGDGLATLAAGLDENHVIVRLALAGDLDGNGIINGDDYYILDTAFLAGLTEAAGLGHAGGDLNHDGAVDARDYLLLDRAYLVHAASGQPASLAGAFNHAIRIAPAADAVPPEVEEDRWDLDEMAEGVLV